MVVCFLAPIQGRRLSSCIHLGNSKCHMFEVRMKPSRRECIDRYRWCRQSSKGRHCPLSIESKKKKKTNMISIGIDFNRTHEIETIPWHASTLARPCTHNCPLPTMMGVLELALNRAYDAAHVFVSTTGKRSQCRFGLAVVPPEKHAKNINC